MIKEADLREETYDLLGSVREPSTEEQKEFEARGFVFLPVEPITLPQVIEESPAHFRAGELAWVNKTPDLRDYALPNLILVAVKPTELFIPGSFGKDRPTQLVMTKDHSVDQIEPISPDARAVMLPATGQTQLDKAHKRKKGNILYMRGFGRTLDNISEDRAGFVGRFGRYRSGLPDPLQVGSWRAHDIDPSIGAALTVIFTAAA